MASALSSAPFRTATTALFLEFVASVPLLETSLITFPPQAPPALSALFPTANPAQQPTCAADVRAGTLCLGECATNAP